MNPLLDKTIVLWDALGYLPDPVLKSWRQHHIQYLQIHLPDDPAPSRVSEHHHLIPAYTPEAFQQLQQLLHHRFGKLDVFIQLSATLHPLSPIEHTTYDGWQQLLNYNLNQPFLLINQLLPLLKRSVQGDIFLANHGMYESSLAYWGAFYVSQMALQALQKVLHEELEHTTVRVHQLDLTKHPGTLRSIAFPAAPSSSIAPSSILEQIKQGLIRA